MVSDLAANFKDVDSNVLDLSYRVAALESSCATKLDIVAGELVSLHAAQGSSAAGRAGGVDGWCSPMLATPVAGAVSYESSGEVRSFGRMS